MKMPNLDQAVVPEPKVANYLLSETHRDGRHKAAFFVRFGFKAEAWQELAAALLNHARMYDVVREESSPFCVRYVIEGAMPAPDGRQPWSERSGSSTLTRISHGSSRPTR